ncbi:uncharacterized PE-PGRS family protein PE_PGRS54-like [Dioscorea cayenensis subsp. rotundata]|uniref:Uncharacterized PE-PGRS family protein PE_PGRS54-like n=1 Tax=Dioscorea cayennensis subsp. rotundata TaxID=55577 RepID=A0AB40AIV6_DIOCR|nr:uncharacterized PE-PGRS family protein PE_PGRS54-like [Dioscorea cayenensis subsp. rotundata]
MACSPTFGSSKGDETFISEEIGCHSLSPVGTSRDDFGGSVAVAGDSMWTSSTLGTSITTCVSFSSTNSTLEEGGTSFLNAASDLMIASTLMLLALTPRGDTGGDAGAGLDDLEGEGIGGGGDNGAYGDGGICGDAGVDGDGGAGGDGLDCLFILPFWEIFFGVSSRGSSCVFIDQSLSLLLVTGCQKPELHLKFEGTMVAFV